MESGALFLFYLLSFLIGSVALIFCTFLYLENKRSFIKYYAAILGVEFFNNISNLMILFFNLKEKIYFNSVAAVSTFFEFLILGFLIFSVTKTKMGVVKTSIISAVLLTSSVSIIAENILSEADFPKILKDIDFMFYLIIFYYLYITIKAYFKENSREIKLILNTIVATFAIAIPLAIVREMFFSNIAYANHLEDSIVYFILNIGGFILFYRKISLKLEIKRETENNESLKIESVETVKEEKNIEDDIKSVAEYNRIFNKEELSAYALTQRESEITELIMEGLTNQEIADKLYISIKTVKTHIYNSYQKLDVRNRTELIYKFKK